MIMVTWQKNQKGLLWKPLQKIRIFEYFMQCFVLRRILVHTYVSCRTSGYVVF